MIDSTELAVLEKKSQHFLPPSSPVFVHRCWRFSCRFPLLSSQLPPISPCFLLCLHFSPGWKLVLFSSLTLDLGAEVHYVNMTALTKGRLLSSFWVVDKRHFYIGSASMDWRSLATVRSLRLTHKPPNIFTYRNTCTETAAAM